MGVFWEGCCYGHSQKGGVSGWSKRRVVLGGIVRRSARGRVRRAVLGMESVKSSVRGGFREGH